MPRILVIEDDPSNADVIQQILESEDFEVESIDGPEIIDESIDSFSPDLILMDILLPTGDGRLICNSIKENPDTKQIPVMLITAMLESEIPRIPCLPDAIMLKPFDYQKLTRTVKKLIHKRERYS
jgi:CheY-like chemotaxis protein